jgi:molybdate transport system substrate-binding protein
VTIIGAVRRCARVLVPLVALAFFATACGSDGNGTSTATAAASSTPITATTTKATGNITVFAAASLTDAYKKIGDAFQAANPEAKVTFNFGASSTLVSSIDGQGAPADVFASADTANMDKLVAAGNAAGTPVVFAKNSLQIIVQAGNPKKITKVADLGRSDVAYVTCDVAVPIGKYASQVLQKANVKVMPKSLEADVKGIVTKVVTVGEADAGIVYATDVQAAGSTAQGIDIPTDLNVVATYPIAVVKRSANAPTAQAFVGFVRSSAAQKILAGHGFSAP